MKSLGQLMQDGLQGWEIAVWYHALVPDVEGNPNQSAGYFTDQTVAITFVQGKGPGGRNGAVDAVFVLTETGSNKGYLISEKKEAVLVDNEDQIRAEAIETAKSKLSPAEKLLLSVEDIPRVTERTGDQFNQMDT